jgi:uncharacterized RmlC-like cupin family protein
MSQVSTAKGDRKMPLQDALGDTATSDPDEPAATPAQKSHGVVKITPTALMETRQGLPIYQGISGLNSGAKALSLNMVVIPPGAAARAHRHKGFESAIYLLKGRVKFMYGEGFTETMIHNVGDFIYIAADVPHKPINMSETEEAVAIVARTDPNEQESVELLPEPELKG